MSIKSILNFATTFFPFTSLITWVFPFLDRHICLSVIDANTFANCSHTYTHTHIYIYIYTLSQCLSSSKWHLQMFYILKPYLFFHTYDHIKCSFICLSHLFKQLHISAKRHPEILFIWQPYLFFHIYDH